MSVCTSAASSNEAFTCEKIKEKQIRASCIEARDTKEKGIKNEAQMAQEKESEVAIEKQKELATATVAAKEALKTLKKLNARVTTGISYQDYPAALADAKVGVEQFIESPDSKLLPQVANSMTLAMDHFERANRLWRLKFSQNGVTEEISSVWAEAKFDGFLSAHYYFHVDHQLRNYIDDLSTRYQGIAHEYTRMPNYKYAPIPSDYPTNGTGIYIDSGLSIIWAAASVEIQNTTNLLR